MLAAATALGLAMGIIIGGLGGGGGVLTVPTLVYLLGQTAQDATTGSLVIVGITSLAGVLARVRGGGVDWRQGIAFGIVGIPAAYLGTLLNRHVGQPVLLLAFAALTLLAAAAMLLGTRGDGDPDATDVDARDKTTSATRDGAVTAVRIDRRRRQLLETVTKVVLCGAATGLLTGFLGVGGGFLVVPALVIALRMPMSLAIGTSLLVIALNAVSSIASRIGNLHLDWRIVIPFTVAAVLGTIVGKRLADRLSATALARSFAFMLMAVGLFVAVENIAAL